MVLVSALLVSLVSAGVAAWIDDGQGNLAEARPPWMDTQPTNDTADNAFKVQWELFLRHVVKNEPFPWSLREGAKGVQLAELGLQSWAERRWLDVPAMK